MNKTDMPARLSWERYNATRPYLMPVEPAVYAISIDREIVYVGSTWNLRKRISEHRIRHGYAKDIITPWGDYPSSVEVVVRASRSRRLGDWVMRELRLIHRLQPRFNRMGRGRLATGVRVS